MIAGLLGVGGGIVLVPAFLYTFLALGYDGPQIMQVCLATSLATIVFTSQRSVRAHAKKGAVDWPSCAAGARASPSAPSLGVARGRRHEDDRAHGDLRRPRHRSSASTSPSAATSWRLGDHMPTGIGRAVTAPVIGFLSVLMGIGGGSFGVPLMRLYGVPIHRAVGTASGFGLMIAIPSVIGFLLQGWVRPTCRPSRSASSTCRPSSWSSA